MNKKKITTSLMAVALVSSLAVGSLAWFTSQDTITNPFSTVSTDKNVDNRVDSGIRIHEDFDKDAAKNVAPGQTVKKEVQVHSTAKYDQFVRAKITKEFTYDGKTVDCYVETPTTYTNEQGQKVETKQITFYNSKTDKDIPSGSVKLNPEFIKLNFTSNSNWLDNTATDGFYYYNEVLKAGQNTNNLIDSVTLDGQAGNAYKNLGFNVTVNAESIQAANKAAKDAWKQAPTNFNNTVDAYAPKSAQTSK
ncbi:BsaA family SipW-dependent biofilm matrix protein [Clostridium sp.]|uniref:BsaA family SipW-dependent biofilm matrix protein n=1 Tax=Clostridium sp. TaxID=1506 RepID=UPI0026049F87|nr:BsaA family SipW-dependent biofilm matrix protein [Clostridium sp.]